MIRTRFPPSPTGFVHIGSLRAALFPYLFAKKHGGKFILRIEDTDRERYVEGSVENLLRILTWAGFEVDEGPYLKEDGSIVQKGKYGPYIQSERLDLYKKYALELIDKGLAYFAFDTPEELDAMRERQQATKMPPRYERKSMKNQITLGEAEASRRVAAGEPHVIRMLVPDEGSIRFTDLIRGEIIFNFKEIDDQILLKSDGFPTYHLAVVVDDHLMGVTHIIRGEDWLPSTPKHVLLFQAFGWGVPEMAHMPLLTNEEHQKLSKRKGDVAVEDFKEKGYLAEALINFIAFLGWNPGDNRELFTLSELIEVFSIQKVQKNAAVFNREKLDWYNKQYMMKMDLDDLTHRATPFFINAGVLKKESVDKPKEFEQLKKIINLERTRSATLVELVEKTGFFFADELDYDKELLVWKKSTLEDAKKKLAEVSEFLQNLSESDWTKNILEEKTLAWIGEQGYGVGDVLWPLRVALSGQKNSPGPFEIAEVLGKEKTFARLIYAKS